MVIKFKTLIIVLALCLSWCTAIPSTSNAQDRQSPTQIFKKDFAIDPLKKEPRAPVRSKQERKPVTEEAPNAEEESSPSSILATAKAPDTARPAEDLKLPEERIISVGLIIDPNQETSVESIVKELNQLLIKHQSILPAQIFLTSYPIEVDTLKSREIYRFIAIGGTTEIKPEILKKFPVTHTPTWLIQTAQGLVVLEGFSSIDKYIAPNGYLKSEL